MTDREEEPESGGEMRPEDVDRRFNELIRDLDQDHPAGLPEPTTPAAPPPSDDDEPTLLELWDAELPEDEEDEYVAPEPPPLPWPSLPAIGGVLCVLGGLLLLVRPDIAPLGTNPGRLVGFLVFVGGVWLLISRLRDDPAEDEKDDGAVVLGRRFSPCGPARTGSCRAVLRRPGR
ncbi:hypothetical protein [Glycomyces tenuis]|uniref:hypothetical protein n=1 Tax=Glycomyces tenuis TaxID=58116 RepID=UPI000686B85A|nr:hypothetical protein [Glycomyces tenuis]